MDNDKGENPFSSGASQVTKNRVGTNRPLSPHPPLSPSGSEASRSSRRSVSLIKSSDEAGLFEQMQQSTGVIVKKKNKVNQPPPSSSPVDDLLKASSSLLKSFSASQPWQPKEDTSQGGAEEQAKYSPTTASHAAASHAHSTRSKDLDLKNNDNSFHVIASLLVEYFTSKVVQGDATKLLVQPSDKAQVERLLPSSARSNFIEAVQYRLGFIPAQASTPLHVLTLQCQALNLDADDASNPLVTVMELTNDPVLIEVLPTNLIVPGAAAPQAQPSPMEEQSVASKHSHLEPSPVASKQSQEASVTSTLAAPQPYQEHNGQLRVEIPHAASKETPAQLPSVNLVEDPNALVEHPSVPENQSSDGSGTVDLQGVGGGGSSVYGGGSRHTVVTTESLARQQLLAELREASNLMAESVTPETAKFWRDHVLELQARLRALHGESPSVAGSLSKSPAPEAVLADNRRLVSKFQEREQYVPPAISSTFSKSKTMDSVSKSKTMDSATNALDEPYDAPMVDVVAPADLPGGYPFEAEIEGQRFLAIVPQGGVRQGDTFSCYMRELDSVAIDIPVGHWKDGLFSCLKYGCCHPVFFNSIVCPLIVLAQTATRINLDFLGRPRENKDGYSNRAMMLMVMFFWVLLNLLLFAGYNVKWSQGMELSIADLVSLALVNGAMLGFIVFVTQSMRSSIREKFMIRETCCCYDLEDLCCATWCLPCTISQMSRHTANFDDYEAVCCSKSGLPDGVKVTQTPIKGTDTYVV